MIIRCGMYASVWCLSDWLDGFIGHVMDAVISKPPSSLPVVFGITCIRAV